MVFLRQIFLWARFQKFLVVLFISYNISHTIKFFSIVNSNKRTSSTIPFGYGKLQTKIPKIGTPPQRNIELKKHEQTVSADLEEEKMLWRHHPVFDVNDYFK